MKGLKVLWAPDGASAGGAGGAAGGGDGGANNVGGDTRAPGGVSFTPEQQAHIDKVIAERLERDRVKRESDAKATAEAAAKKAEEDKLAAQGVITVTNGNPFTATGTYQPITAAGAVTPTVTGNRIEVTVT